MILKGVATVTDTIDLGTGNLLLPLYNPVRLADHGTILDALSDGQFILGTAVGYRLRESELLTVNWDHRGARYERDLTLLSQL